MIHKFNKILCQNKLYNLIPQKLTFLRFSSLSNFCRQFLYNRLVFQSYSIRLINSKYNAKDASKHKLYHTLGTTNFRFTQLAMVLDELISSLTRIKALIKECVNLYSNSDEVYHSNLLPLRGM